MTQRERPAVPLIFAFPRRPVDNPTDGVRRSGVDWECDGASRTAVRLRVRMGALGPGLGRRAFGKGWEQPSADLAAGPRRITVTPGVTLYR
jgi:hypothetical protein